jgi:hypothetical protein
MNKKSVTENRSIRYKMLLLNTKRTARINQAFDEKLPLEKKL